MRSGPSHGQETERDGNVLDASAVDPQFAYLFASLITDFSIITGELGLFPWAQIGSGHGFRLR